jgi:arylsulfatase A-like enzyme
VLTIVGLVVPGLRSWQATLAGFLTLATLSILLLSSQLHRGAAILIALGVGVQGVRILSSRRVKLDRIVAVTLPFLAGLVLLLGLGVTGWSFLQEKRAVSRLVPSRSGAPNIILIVLDTVRRASMSLYGYQRNTTPALERWARRGVLFDHAIATASWTLPSHASMFTGQLPGAMSAGWLTPLDAHYPVIAERLRDDGYLTAGFVANILYGNRSFGLARGFIHYEDYRVTPGEVLVNSSVGRALSESHVIRRLAGYHDILGRKPGASITDDFLGWREQNPDRPYFAFLNYFDAHQPYLPPADLAESFGPTGQRDFGLLELRPYMGKIAQAEQSLSVEQAHAEQSAYDATLAYLDREMDRLLTALDRQGQLTNTIVIITSDHGEQFREHGLFDHGNSLYRFAIEVPLLMVGGDLPNNAVVATPVSLQNIPATIMALTRARGEAMPGQSLTDSVREASPRPVISQTSGPGPARRFESIIADGYHAIWSADTTELYSFSGDPDESADLARTVDGGTILRSLRLRLDSLVGTQQAKP